MYFLIKVENFFRKIKWNLGKSYQYYQKIFNGEPVHNKKYLKAGENNQHKRSLSLCLCTSSIDSLYRKDEIYYQVFLEKYNFVIEKKMLVFNNIEICFDDFYNEYYDEEYHDDSDEESSDEKIQMNRLNIYK